MSQRARRTQVSLSQPSTSTSVFSQEADEYAPNSQSSPNKSLSDQEHAHHVANAVKYILAADQTKVPISKQILSKAIDCHGKNFRSVMTTVEAVLLDVFGYKLMDIDTGKFVLCNMVKNELPHLRFSEEIGNRYVLLFLVLSHIFMNGEVCSEDSLVKFLKNLEILDPNRINNEFFGNVLEVIKNDFVKEKYLNMTKAKSDTEAVEFRWGERAKLEVSERSVMEFVSTVYDDRSIETWPQQYKRLLEIEEEGKEPTNSQPNGHHNGIQIG